jgi:hypothetical protein
VPVEGGGGDAGAGFVSEDNLTGDSTLPVGGIAIALGSSAPDSSLSEIGEPRIWLVLVSNTETSSGPELVV